MAAYLEERFVLITHEKTNKTVYTRFTYMEKNFAEFVKTIDYLHDTKCKVVKIDEDDFEDFPDIFSDEKLEICLDEGFGKFTNRV